MDAKRPRVVTSPREAAMGVATLSGLMCNLRDKRTTPIVIKPEN